MRMWANSFRWNNCNYFKQLIFYRYRYVCFIFLTLLSVRFYRCRELSTELSRRPSPTWTASSPRARRASSAPGPSRRRPTWWPPTTAEDWPRWAADVHHQTTAGTYVAFFPATIRRWNRIPEEAKTVVCCRSFKQAIAQFFNLTKPPLYYSLGHKFDNILHTRLRLDLSGLHAHLFKINSHLVDTPNCSCEPIPETVKHYLFFCPRYVVQRKELESSLINYIKHYAKLTVNDKLAILVFGHNLNNATGLAVAASVQKYIRNTKRFVSP